MRRSWIALAVVLAASGWALGSAAWNRLGADARTIELTERELPLEWSSDEDTAVRLRLDYGQPDEVDGLDEDALRRLGFDLGVAASDDGAFEHYWAQRPRRAWAALRPGERGLVVAAVDDDPRRLAERFPESTQTVILPAAIAVQLRLEHGPGGLLRDARVEGRVRFVMPRTLLVPMGHASALERLDARSGPPAAPRYAVELRSGRRFEPWIAGVERLD